MYSDLQYLPESEHIASTLLREGDYTSLPDILERIARYLPEAPILSQPETGTLFRTRPAAALREEAENLGAGLAAAGLRGAHVAIVARNSCRYVTAVLALACGAGVAVPVDVQAPPGLLATLLDRCDAEAVLCDSLGLPGVLEARAHCPRIRTVITLDEPAEGFPSYDGLLAAGRKGSPCPAPDPDAPALILFSSGTTGSNKAVTLSGANMLANINQVLHALHTSGERRCMGLLPFHHAAGIMHVLLNVAAGRHTLVCADVRESLSFAAAFRPERIQVVPMMVEAFHRQGKTRETFGGSLRTVISCAATLRPELIEGMEAQGLRILNAYGSTECGPVVSINSDTRHDPLSVGPPVPGLEIRLETPDDDGVGTLLVRGKSVALGYYKDPEATRAVFGPDGFFNTGDSVRIDGRGRIHLMGRKANTIVLPNGENVYPEELERLVCGQLDYVAEAIVYPARFRIGNASRTVLCIGLYIPDPARRSDRARIGSDLLRINRALPAFKRIEYAELPDAPYPKTASHKLRRTGLPEDCSQTGIILTQR